MARLVYAWTMSPRGRSSRKQRERMAEQKLAAPERAPAEVRRLVVLPAEAGARLDRILAARLPELSRGRVQELIARGLVRWLGEPLFASARPEAGAQLEVRLPPARVSALVPVELALPVLYQDEFLLVIDKPAGLAVHPGPGERGVTVLHGLLALLGGQKNPRLAHRLDKETSGCLAVAKTEPALRGLQAAFRSRAVEKQYRALVHGAPPDSGEFDTLHGPHPTEPRRFSTRVAAGQRALTRYRVLGRGVQCALLDIALLSGRTHQIRAHFADAGFPLLGDKLYGGAAPARLATAALGRLALHAFTLAFAHPITGAAISCTAPLPADFRAALAALNLAAVGA